jgi:anti-sigma factor RsiW
LVAYVDGELDVARAQEVEAALDLDPELRSRVRIFRETSRVLRTALGGSSREAVSPRLAKALDRPRPGVGGGRRRLAVPLAASLAALTVGLGGGYVTGIQHTQQIAHAGVDHWLEEAGKYYRLYAEDESYLTEINAEEARNRENKLGDWLNRDLRIPDLSRHGLTFLGARFVALEVDPAAPGGARPAILLTYNVPGGRPLALCIVPYGTSSTGSARATATCCKVGPTRDCFESWRRRSSSSSEISEPAPDIMSASRPFVSVSEL